jgi:hypothetical protein
LLNLVNISTKHRAGKREECKASGIHISMTEYEPLEGS